MRSCSCFGRMAFCFPCCSYCSPCSEAQNGRYEH
uniref:Thioredoxin-like domain n=1 Tax=Siphoviridae sp. ctw757 TaxID=2827969 RepID=A0A8S5TBB6_9CAUD|nr:MAG TPA: Thioredoxin-like domain [Siphoviridae sp. ctw757]